MRRNDIMTSYIKCRLTRLSQKAFLRNSALDDKNCYELTRQGCRVMLSNIIVATSHMYLLST